MLPSGAAPVQVPGLACLAGRAAAAWREPGGSASIHAGRLLAEHHRDASGPGLACAARFGGTQSGLLRYG